MSNLKDEKEKQKREKEEKALQKAIDNLTVREYKLITKAISDKNEKLSKAEINEVRELFVKMVFESEIELEKLDK